MKFIDMHCDTLMLAYIQDKKNLKHMDGMLDIERMKQAGQLAQFFAIFMPPPESYTRFNRDQPIKDDEYIDYCIDAFYHTMEENKENIRPAYTSSDVLENERNGWMSGLLTLEDGRSVQSDWEKLKVYYDKGIRLLTLTWNHANCFGFPNSQDPKLMQKGLTTFGKESISYLNDLGMLIDVSHLSDGGFWDVIELSKRPIVASHSNARTLSPHPRNLTDEMIRAIAENGGLIGINFCPAFLTQDLKNKKTTVQDLVKHIKYIHNLAGSDTLALGSDFDGISGELEVPDPSKMHLIFEAMEREGFSTEDIEKLAYQNALRVMKDVLD